jgi:pyruvate formate lyase activating enzyme
MIGIEHQDELENTARLIKDTDPAIPFTILAFFPEYRMKDSRTPSVSEMVETYDRTKSIGLENVRLGNLGVFARTQRDMEYLSAHLEGDAY